MKGLIVVGTTIIGAGLGGTLGVFTAMFKADMDIGSLDAVGYIFGGVAIGAISGAYLGGQLV